MNFNYYMPTKVIMGENCICENANLFSSLGKKAMIVTGTKSAKINGAQEDVITAFNMVGITYVIYDKVMNNPTMGCAYEGALFAKNNSVDFVVGIGGGSPMDAAKAMALLAAQEIKEDALFSGEYKEAVLPLVMVPTTAGTGSEVTQYAILTNDKAQTKTSIATPILFPKFSFLDGKYMKTLSMDTTINTGLDALSHAVEGMLTKRATQITNLLALESIRKISKSLPCLLEKKNKQGDNLPINVREDLLYGSTLAGMVIAHTGTTVVHSMGYSLTYFKDVDHGRANGLILPSFLRFVEKSDHETIQKILKGMEYDSLDELETMFISLLGEREVVTEEEIECYASIAERAKNVLNSKVVPTREDIIDIYKRSF